MTRHPVIAFILLLGVQPLWAHPVPDIPVFSTFTMEKVNIEVIIDPRSFSDDPEGEPYMHFSELERKEEAAKDSIKKQAQALIDETVSFLFFPSEKVRPTFSFEFVGLDKSPLVEKTDPVMLIGVAELNIPESATHYQILAEKTGVLSVIFRNSIRGEEVNRYNVLFPGESSFELDITQR
ncbi:MAG: hypothetical protein AAGA96_14030 [Verrucomicrobiota bacterium]